MHNPLPPCQAQALVEQLRQQQAELAQVPLPPVTAAPAPIPEDEPVDVAPEEPGVDAPGAEAEVPETKEQEATVAEPPFETPTESRKRRESMTKNAEQVTRKTTHISPRHDDGTIETNSDATILFPRPNKKLDGTLWYARRRSPLCETCKTKGKGGHKFYTIPLLIVATHDGFLSKMSAFIPTGFFLRGGAKKDGAEILARGWRRQGE